MVAESVMVHVTGRATDAQAAAGKALQQGRQQLQTMLADLQKAFGGAAQQVPAQPPAFSQGRIDPQVAANPQKTIINIHVNFNGGAPQAGQPSSAPLQNFPLMPESSGAAGSFAAAANVFASRLTGSNTSQYTFDANGPWNAANKDEKVAIAHAFHKNPNVKFDTDTKSFFVTGTDGSRRDVATLDEVVSAGRKAGGFTTGNAAAITQIAGLLDGRINSSPGTSGSAGSTGAAPAGSTQHTQPQNALQEIMNLFQKLIEILTGHSVGAQAAAATGGTTGTGGVLGTGSGQGMGGAQSSAPAASTSQPGGASASNQAGAAGTSAASGGEGWGAIDSMMAEAEKLAKSKNPSDQLRAQQMMNQAQQMFQTISKLLQQMAEMFKTAIGNIR
jgi:hypothetical protein